MVMVLTGWAVVPRGLANAIWTCTFTAHHLLRKTRERTGQKELRLSIRKRSSVNGVWRKLLSVRDGTLNSLWPTLEDDPHRPDSSNKIQGRFSFSFCQMATRVKCVHPKDSRGTLTKFQPPLRSPEEHELAARIEINHQEVVMSSQLELQQLVD